MNVVDSSINSLCQNPDLSDHEIQVLLQTIYSNVSTLGISPNSVSQIVRFLCQSSIISLVTKKYIVNHCLLPNDFIPVEVVSTIVKSLGTPTFSSSYKLGLPQTLQIALCRWLVHVYPLIEDTSIFSKCYSSLFQLWQFDYLQTPITYLLVWSTKSVHVTPWRVMILKKIGIKSGYQNSNTLATAILKRYLSIRPHEMINEVLKQLSCNSRKLNHFKELVLDGQFMNSWKIVLNHNNRLLEQEFQEIFQYQLTSLHDHDDLSVVWEDTHVDGIPLAEVSSLGKLANNISRIGSTIDIERLVLRNTSVTRMYIALLPPEDKTYANIELWCKLQLKSIFYESRYSKEEKLSLMLKILHLNLLFDGLLTSIEEEFLFNQELLSKNDEIYLRFYPYFLSLWKPQKWDQLKSTTNIWLAASINTTLANGGTLTFVSITKAVLLMVNLWLKRDQSYDIFISCLHISSLFLKMVFKYANNFPNDRHMITTAIKALDNILSLPRDQLIYENLNEILLSSSSIHGIMLSNDPLLISALTKYLVGSKDLLIGLRSEDKFVQLQNQYVIDITNYLWRNKILPTNKLFDIPTGYLKNITDNLYIADSMLKVKSLFTITGIPAFSFASKKAIESIELENRCTVIYKNPVSEVGFNSFKKQLLAKNNEWLPSVRTFEDLRLLILRRFDQDGVYGGVADFLFTYLKSLSHKRTKISS